MVATDASAARYVAKSVEKTASTPPFKCDRTRDQFVIDEDVDNCNGISSMNGPGWQRYAFAASGGAYHYITRVKENGTETATWSPTITQPGTYEVWVSWRSSGNRTSAAPFFVFTDEENPNAPGENINYKIVINQIGSGAMRYSKLGTFRFDAHTAAARPVSGYVMAKNVGIQTSESIDAAYFRLVEAGPGGPGPGPEPGPTYNDADTVPVPGDYDGDGSADLAVYHTATGTWDIEYSSGAPSLLGHAFGGGALTIPVPGDFDGDFIADMALYHPATGNWDIDYSGDTPSMVNDTFGWEGAVPVQGDFDNDKKADRALYHQASGLWYIEYSTGKASLLGGHIQFPAP